MRIEMRRVSTAVTVLCATLLALPAFVSAQSLGEAAEKAKRERKGGAKPKVITDADLRRGTVPEPPVSSSESTTAAEPAPADAAATGAPAKEKTEDELRAEAEAAWRKRLQDKRDEIARLNSEASQLQASLNDLSQNLYGSNRATTMTRLDEVKKQLAAAQGAVTDLEEEGRRSRFRP